MAKGSGFKNLGKISFILSTLLIFSFVVLLHRLAFGQVTIKCASVAPEGTEWANLAKRAAEEIERKTGIKVVWYLSGAVGDEPEIARNVKERKIDCAALTGNGLTYLIPPVRILELPLLFRDMEEVDKMRNDITPFLVRIARDYRLRFIYLSEFGTVHIFSKFPIRSVDDIRGKRAWVWKGDFLAEHIGKVLQEEYGVRPVAIPLNDVYSYLQNIDIVYNSFYGLTSFGWDKGMKYYLTQPLTLSFVGLVISLDVFNQLDQEKQNDFESIFRAFMEQISHMNRRNNRVALEMLKSRGYVATSIPEEQLRVLEGVFQERIWNGLKERLYPSWLLTEVLTRLSEYRVRRK